MLVQETDKVALSKVHVVRKYLKVCLLQKIVYNRRWSSNVMVVSNCCKSKRADLVSSFRFKEQGFTENS